MSLRLVASNPDIGKASAAERVARKLKFADAELQRLRPEAGSAEDIKLLDGLRATLRAAVGVLVSRENAS